MLRRTLALVLPAAWALGISPAAAQTGDTSSDGQALAFLALMGICIVVYVLPSVVAFYRGHPNRWPILAINIVFGGTGLGWLGSLIWAFGAVHKSSTGSNGGESGLNLFANDPLVLRINPSNDTAPDPVSQLARIKTMFDNGVLTAGEYESLRRPIVRALLPGGGR